MPASNERQSWLPGLVMGAVGVLLSRRAAQSVCSSARAAPHRVQPADGQVSDKLARRSGESFFLFRKKTKR